MKNCEVVIIVVSVLNSSNFSKKNPGIISGYPEIKKTYSSSGEKKKNTDGFLAAYLLTLARERCARHLVMPKKTKNNLRKNLQNKFAEILKQTLDFCFRFTKQTNMQSHD